MVEMSCVGILRTLTIRSIKNEPTCYTVDALPPHSTIYNVNYSWLSKPFFILTSAMVAEAQARHAKFKNALERSLEPFPILLRPPHNSRPTIYT